MPEKYDYQLEMCQEGNAGAAQTTGGASRSGGGSSRQDSGAIARRRRLQESSAQFLREQGGIAIPNGGPRRGFVPSIISKSERVG